MKPSPGGGSSTSQHDSRSSIAAVLAMAAPRCERSRSARRSHEYATPAARWPQAYFAISMPPKKERRATQEQGGSLPPRRRSGRPHRDIVSRTYGLVMKGSARYAMFRRRRPGTSSTFELSGFGPTGRRSGSRPRPVGMRRVSSTTHNSPITETGEAAKTGIFVADVMAAVYAFGRTRTRWRPSRNGGAAVHRWRSDGFDDQLLVLR